MAGESHGFTFDHISRRPASFRQRRTKSTTAVDTRSSFRLPSIRSALFAGNAQATKNRQQNGRETSTHNKTQSYGVLRSLFGRQVDNKSPPGGDLWVDVDLHRPASPSLDDVSMTSSSDWVAAETGQQPEMDRSGSMEEVHLAMVRRSNSARPAMRRPLPMRVQSVLPQSDCRAETPGNGTGVMAEAVWVRDKDMCRGTHDESSYNNARLSADSGHVSCKLGISKGSSTLTSKSTKKLDASVDES